LTTRGWTRRDAFLSTKYLCLLVSPSFYASSRPRRSRAFSLSLERRARSCYRLAMSGWLEHRPLYPSDRAAHRLYLVRAPSVAAARAQFRFPILVKQARAAAEHVRPRELGRAKRQAGQIGAPLGTRRAHGGRCGDRVARSERVRICARALRATRSTWGWSSTRRWRSACGERSTTACAGSGELKSRSYVGTLKLSHASDLDTAQAHVKAAGTPRATSTRGRRARRAGVSTAFGRLAGVTPDRAMPQHSLTVGGTQYDVDFPYAPYDCQLTMMEKVLESLTTGRNALLESPTGTARAATRRRRPLPPRHARRRHPRSPRSVGTRKQQGFLTARRGSRISILDPRRERARR
jgi:hypothetical protein